MIAGQTAIEFLRRHMSCDFGELADEDIQENELSLREGFRVLSAYRTSAARSFGLLPKPTAAQRRLFSPPNTDLKNPRAASASRTRAAFSIGFPASSLVSD